MFCAYREITHIDFAAAIAGFELPRIVLWTYIAGLLLFVIGVTKIVRDELPQSHGLDKIMSFGRLFFAIPMAVFATEHFTDTADIASGVPQWMPAHTFWAYLVGVSLLAAAFSITLNVQSRLAAILLGVMFCCFVLMIHVPNILSDKGNRILWAVGARDLAFAGGAFALAGARTRAKRGGSGALLVIVARFFVGIPAVFFGVEHFRHPTYAPGVPLGKVIPEWIPGRLFWAYLAGAVLVAAGLCILANKKMRLAATYLGVMILLLVLFVYLPILIASPSDIVSVNYFFDTLMFSGAILLLADASNEQAATHI
jgi:uncharacterized membrane protein